MPLNSNAPAFTPSVVIIPRPKRPFRDGETPRERTMRRSARRLESLRRRRMAAEQSEELQVKSTPSAFPVEYMIASPKNILSIQRELLEHFQEEIASHSPNDTPVIRMDGQFSFRIETTKKNGAASTTWTHVIVSADPSRNYIAIHAWYSNGLNTMFHPDGRTFAPVSLITTILDNTDTNCGEIEYTYDHSFVHGKTIEYGHVNFRDGLKNALKTVEFY